MMGGGGEVLVKEGDLYNGKWKVLDKLGSGTYGVVYHVENEKTEEEYAMKVARDTEAATETWALLLLRGCCYFPNLYEMFPIGCAFQHTAMILDLGVGDLYNMRINNDTGIYEKQTALCLSHHIFSGLEYLHKKCIIHRDMKEANIVLKRDCRNQKHPIMIVDLGLAISNKVPRNPDQRDSFFKEWFSSPWMTSGKVATPRCDLTMVLYFLLTWRERGPWRFNDSEGMTCLQKRADFEINPEKYVPPGETWIVELAKCIFSIDQSGTPNYKRIQEILKNAETNFDPKMKQLHVSDNEGKECLF